MPLLPGYEILGGIVAIKEQKMVPHSRFDEYSEVATRRHGQCDHWNLDPEYCVCLPAVLQAINLLHFIF
jgi:hypothetical protein